MTAGPGGVWCSILRQGSMRAQRHQSQILRLAHWPHSWARLTPHSPPRSTALPTVRCNIYAGAAHEPNISQDLPTAAFDFPWGLHIRSYFCTGVFNLCTIGRKNKCNHLSGRCLPGYYGKNTRNKILSDEGLSAKSVRNAFKALQRPRLLIMILC